jgi:hypothetical protein
MAVIEDVARNARSYNANSKIVGARIAGDITGHDIVCRSAHCARPLSGDQNSSRKVPLTGFRKFLPNSE